MVREYQPELLINQLHNLLVLPYLVSIIALGKIGKLPRAIIDRILEGFFKKLIDKTISSCLSTKLGCNFNEFISLVLYHSFGIQGAE